MEPIAYPYRFPKTDDLLWRQYLTNYGFVVIGDVVAPNDCDRILDEMRGCLSIIYPTLKKDDINSFGNDKNYPASMEHGINSVIAHQKFLWDVRQEVVPMFEKVHNCKAEDLATSFGSFTYADGRRDFGELEPFRHLHTDQSPDRHDFWMAQGQLNLVDNGEQDGGLIVFPGSHLKHQEIHEKVGIEKTKDISEFNQAQIDKLIKDELIKKEEWLKVCARAGDLILFDSRILHSYVTPKSSNLRACIFVCQVPKESINEKVLEKRTKAWNGKECSKHFPGERFEAFRFGVNAEILGKILDMAIKDEQMTEIQKSLLYIKKE